MTNKFETALTFSGDSIYFELQNISEQDLWICTYGLPFESLCGPQLNFTDSTGMEAPYKGEMVKRLSPEQNRDCWIAVSHGLTLSKQCEMECYDLKAGETYDVRLSRKVMFYTTSDPKYSFPGRYISYSEEVLQPGSCKYTAPSSCNIM
jgi:hypothetical protein